jgi:hypothetical protein
MSSTNAGQIRDATCQSSPLTDRVRATQSRLRRLSTTDTTTNLGPSMGRPAPAGDAEASQLRAVGRPAGSVLRDFLARSLIVLLSVVAVELWIWGLTA